MTTDLREGRAGGREGLRKEERRSPREGGGGGGGGKGKSIRREDKEGEGRKAPTHIEVCHS